MNKVVLDASALLALINNEKGANIIEPLIGNIIMSSVNSKRHMFVLLKKVCYTCANGNN
jgi:ribonuclease VapC